MSTHHNPAAAAAARAACEPLPRIAGAFAPDGSDFAWGPIVETHKVGHIAIVEYLRDCSNLHSHDPAAYDAHGQTFYAVFLGDAFGNYRSTSHSCRSLDSALVAAIAIKREGLNTRAHTYFDRMTLEA